MKRYLSLFLLLFAFQLLAAGPVLVRSTSTSQFWKFSKQNKSFIALTKSKNGKQFSLAGLDSNKFAIKVERDKRKMLTMMGVSDWKVTKRNWQTRKDEKILSLYGSYKDRNGSQVNFIERHHYRKESSAQGLLTTSVDPLQFEKILVNKLEAFTKGGE